MSNGEPAFEFLKTHGIEWFLTENGVAYERREDLIVVPGDLNLTGRGLTALPDLSQVIVEGSFYCDGNELTSLKGAPQCVGMHYGCSRNQLTSLKYSPDRVRGMFNCSMNQLTSLKWAPRIVGELFFCHDNQIATLEGGPSKVFGSYHCYNNPLVSTKGKPRICGFLNTGIDFVVNSIEP